MLTQLYTAIKDQLLSIDGMTAQPYAAKTGKVPTGGIEQFELKGRNFVGLRLTDAYLMLYAGPLLALPTLEQHYSESLKPIRSGKGCLKITRPEKANMDVLTALFAEGAAAFQATSATASSSILTP